MEKTVKAIKELEKLTIQKVDLDDKRVGWLRKANGNVGSWEETRLYRKEADRLELRIYNIEGKIETIEKEGISTSERNSLKKEAMRNFTTIEFERSLGTRDYRKIGFSKSLNQYVEVRITRWTGFMDNVKGCRSLANKTIFNGFIFISKEEYDNRMKGMKRLTTGFCGTETKEIPIHQGI